MDGIFSSIFKNLKIEEDIIIKPKEQNIIIEEQNIIIEEPKTDIEHKTVQGTNKNITIRNYKTKKTDEEKIYIYDCKKYNDTFREKKKDKITCFICGAKINYYAKSLHLKSKKCLKVKNNI